jgi:phosphohistidine phosphatase
MPIDLYLVQHGEAKSEAEDPERPLTEKGRDEVARVAQFLRQRGARPETIRHSGKRRAEQTAAIFADALAPAVPAAAASGLAPNDPVEPVAAELEREGGAVMLVGHQPFMGRLAAYLLTGDASRPVVRFRMGGVVCLARDGAGSGAGGQWVVAWAVTPDLLA